MQLFKDQSKDLKYDRICISIGYVVIAVVAVMTFVLLHGHIDTALAEAERFATDQSAHVTGEVLGRFEDYEQICRILSTDINAVKYVKAFQSGSDAEMLTWSYELTKELSYTVKLFNIDIKNLAYYFPENDSAVTMAQWYRPGSGRAFFDAYPDLDLETLTAAQKGISLLMDEQGSGQGWVVCRARVYGDSISALSRTGSCRTTRGCSSGRRTRPSMPARKGWTAGTTSASWSRSSPRGPSTPAAGRISGAAGGCPSGR